MRLSIITINLNNKVGLLRTCKSVAGQTCRNFDWIIIDGGSSDGSQEVISEYKKYLSYAVSEHDKGIYNAMNKGIDKATGNYCLFLNSGDWFYNSQVVADLYRAIQGINTTFIFGRMCCVASDGYSTFYKLPQHISGFYLFKGVLPHQSTLTRTDVLKRFHYKEGYRIVSDWLFAVEQILKYGASASHVDVVVSNYMLDGISSTDYAQTAAERERGFIEIMGLTVFEDYRRLCFGDTYLEKLLRKSEKFPLLFKIMQVWNLPIAALYKLRSLMFQHLKK